MLLSASNITKAYGSLPVLKDVSIEIPKGAFVSIIGPSGAGKSTLLHILGTLDLKDSGSLNFKDTALDQLSEKDLATLRNKHFGFIFQFHNLLPEFTALENVCMPAWISREQGDKSRSEEQIKNEAIGLLGLLGLSERADHLPSELSGGEQQRVAVARALINKPDVVFADEPSGNLDSANAAELHALFLDLNQNHGQTFVVITHNDVFANMASTKLAMKDGKLLQN